MRTCYTYDKSDNVLTMLDYKVSNNVATLYRYTGFAYDYMNRMTKLTELNTNKALADITAEELETNTTQYTYHPVDGNYILTYDFDAVGNRIMQKKNTVDQSEMTVYNYNSLNQLTSSETRNIEGTVISRKTYQYDANGSQTQEADSITNTQTNNTYDAAGRLETCTEKENGTVTLQQTNLYNGSGARIQKAEDGKVTNYFYSQGSVLYTEDGSGNATSLNLQGVSGNIIATAREEDGVEGYYYYHKDPAGSTTNLRAADGTSVVSYQYSDFGETSIYGNTDFYNEICYNEAIYDASTGLYYLSARYYNPEDGRFLTRDSYRRNAMNPSTLHLYAYCANNPINYEDPSGHIAISRIIGGVVGAAIGAFAGAKIAKKTNAKGWKKVAIIAGCAIGGGVIGALAGPKVAKVAKRAASYVKNKLPSKARSFRASKNTVTKPTTTNVKTTKTKQAIYKAKSKLKNKANNVVNKQNTVDIQLKYKKSWTAAQRTEADAKEKALTESYTVKKEVHRVGTSPLRRYQRVFGKGSVPKGYDVDHIIDLQLGGIDDVINMRPLDRSVNRSLGVQIKNAIKNYSYGTVFGKFTIG